MSVASYCRAALNSDSPGQEEHDEFGGLGELLPIRPRREPRDVILHEARVVAQRIGALGLVRRIHRVQPGRHRGLGVDHDRAPAREEHRQVRAQSRVRCRHLFLEHEVDVLDHLREFADPLQLKLAPLPAHDGTAQRVQQVLRLVAEVAVRLGEGGELGQEGVGALGLRPTFLAEAPFGVALRAQRGDGACVSRAEHDPGEGHTEGPAKQEPGNEVAHVMLRSAAA